MQTNQMLIKRKGENRESGKEKVTLRVVSTQIPRVHEMLMVDTHFIF